MQKGPWVTCQKQTEQEHRDGWGCPGDEASHGPHSFLDRAVASTAPGTASLAAYLCLLDPQKDLPGLPFLCAPRSLAHHARDAFGVAGMPCPCPGEKRNVLC